MDIDESKVEEPSNSPRKGFRKELEILINRYSMENGSDTPDFILAEYLDACLEAFDSAVQRRTHWYRPPEQPNGTTSYEFEVGDTVKVMAKRGAYAQREGTVKRIGTSLKALPSVSPSKYPIFVKFMDGAEGFFRHNELELFSKTEERKGEHTNCPECQAVESGEL